MNYLHYHFDLSSDDIIEVELDRQANVRLLDDKNFTKYTKGEQYRYYGGLAKTSPVHLSPPRKGHWHLVIDLGGYPGTIRASVTTISPPKESTNRIYA